MTSVFHVAVSIRTVSYDIQQGATLEGFDVEGRRVLVGPYQKANQKHDLWAISFRQHVLTFSQASDAAALFVAITGGDGVPYGNA